MCNRGFVSEVEHMLDDALDAAVQPQAPPPVAWELTANDRRLLRRLDIDPEH